MKEISAIIKSTLPAALFVLTSAVFSISCDTDCDDVYLGRFDVADSSLQALPEPEAQFGEMTFNENTYSFELSRFQFEPEYATVYHNETGEKQLTGRLNLIPCKEYLEVQQLQYWPEFGQDVPISFKLNLTKNIGDLMPASLDPRTEAVHDVLLITAYYSSTYIVEYTDGPGENTFVSSRTFPLSLQRSHIFVDANQTIEKHYDTYELNGITYEDVYHISLSSPQLTIEEQRLLAEENSIHFVESIFYKKGVGLLAAIISDGSEAHFSWSGAGK